MQLNELWGKPKLQVTTRVLQQAELRIYDVKRTSVMDMIRRVFKGLDAKDKLQIFNGLQVVRFLLYHCQLNIKFMFSISSIFLRRQRRRYQEKDGQKFKFLHFNFFFPPVSPVGPYFFWYTNIIWADGNRN